MPARSAPRRGKIFPAPPVSLLCSGYALTPERHRRRILILIVAMPWPRRFRPPGGQYWTRKGVAIGCDLTAKRRAGSGGRLHFGMVADIKSERWPASNRNRWPDCVGSRKMEGDPPFRRSVRALPSFDPRPRE